MKFRYLVRKLLQAIVTLFFVLLVNYVLFRVMPGNPLNMIMRNPKATPEAIQKIKALFGLGQPWYEQIWIYFDQLLHGNLGMSFEFRTPVINIIAERIPATLLLVGIATIASIAGGIFIGVAAARRRGTKVDIVSLSFSLLTYSMPTFWLGIILVALFSVQLLWFPVSGMVTAGQSYGSYWGYISDIAQHLFLPTLTLTLVLLGQYVLIMRNALLDVLTEDYIQTAKAKGFSEKWIMRKHAVPNARLPMVTLVSMNLGFVIAGAIEIETVYSWPGLGRLMYQALMGRDYPLLEGIFLLVSVCVVVANLFSDLLYGYLDPRVKV